MADGFKAGQSITVFGTASNDGSYIIGSVANSTTITLKAGEGLADEAGVSNVDVSGSSLMPDPETLVDLLTPFTGSAVVTLSSATAKGEDLGGIDHHRRRTGRAKLKRRVKGHTVRTATGHTEGVRHRRRLGTVDCDGRDLH